MTLVSNAAMKRHALWLKTEQHMTVLEIAREAEVRHQMLRDHLNPYKNMRHGQDWFITRVLAVRPTTERYTPAQRGLGARRILRGLLARGWNYGTVAPMVGITRYSMGELVSEKGGDYAAPSHAVYAELLRVAAKLETANPVDYGIPERRVNQNASRFSHHPHLGCWDLDTVHLPESMPEWTGDCGTIRGYTLHRRYEIHVKVLKPYVDKQGVERKSYRVLCEPCSEAHRGASAQTKHRVREQQYERIAEMLADGIPVSAIAADVGLSERTVLRVRDDK